MPSVEEVKAYIDLGLEAATFTGAVATWYFRASIIKAIIKVIRGEANPRDRETAVEGVREGGMQAEIVLQRVREELAAHGDETAGERVRALVDEAHRGRDATPGQMV